MLRLSSYVPLPPKLEKSLSVAADDRRVPDNPKAPQQDKMATLRAYRCAQGLCVKCAQKWSRDHKCPAIVQLHVLEELLDACPIEESTVESDSVMDQPESSEHLFLTEAVQTLKFTGSIQNQIVTILIDSGSSHTFISAQLASKLDGVSVSTKSVQVQIANGGVLSCNSELHNATWSIQGYTFISTLKVLPIASYDMIGGID